MQAGLFEPRHQPLRAACAVGDQVDTHTQGARMGHHLRQIVAQGRLAAGKAHTGHLGLQADAIQHGPDLVQGHLRPVVHAPGAAVAPGIAEHAARVAAVGHRHLGENGKVRKRHAKRNLVHGRGFIGIVQAVLEQLAQVRQKAPGIPPNPGIGAIGRQDALDGFAGDQGRHDGCCLGIETKSPVGPLDEHIVLGADVDKITYIGDPFIHPGQVAGPPRLRPAGKARTSFCGPAARTPSSGTPLERSSAVAGRVARGVTGGMAGRVTSRMAGGVAGRMTRRVAG